MKFARYLQDTQVQEWNKAYIDYRGLKKHISAVRKRQAGGEEGTGEGSSDLGTSTQGQVPHSERNIRDDFHRYRSRHGRKHYHRMGQPHVVIKETDEFFAKLDLEVEKVEAFYLDREKEVKEMFTELKRQLVELQDHQKFFQQCRDTANSRLEAPSGAPTEHQSESRFEAIEYRSAKKYLRKAVLEHYKKLDALQNYRTLNLTGFQKALKKWEKVTRMAARDVYLKEKIEPRAFSSTRTLTELSRGTEDMYTVHFARGNKKRALGNLRAGREHKTHYFAMFRSGLYLGLAIPALVSGLYQSFQTSTRAEIPSWDALLIVYATMFIPVLFSLMVVINIFAWDKVRINHVFIFELDARSKIDYQEYAEIPAALLSTLCYSFWFSFSRIGSPTVAPTTWPLIWLGFNTFVICNPLPVYYRSSRMWLLKRFGSLMVSGSKRIGFAEFWLGDQFCSLTFSLANLYFVGCIYHSGFKPNWPQSCSIQAPHWEAPLVLAISPLFCRFVQSLRRWYDTRSRAHLINAGKYSSGIITSGFYFYWRHQGTSVRGIGFVLYIITAVIYSIYACCWDFVADWSVLKIRTKYPLLREDILYAEHIPSYYLAIITNLLIRFAWIIYIPSRGPSINVRTFIVAMLEMFRRWQWNFFRLESEHLGNVDQYRVTHQIPLPYRFDPPSHDSDDEDCGDEDESSKGLAKRVFVRLHHVHHRIGHGAHAHAHAHAHR